jgi:hypothetical protein
MPYSTLTTYGEGPFVQVLESNLHRILRSILEQVEVDERWYRDKYRDVDEAIASGKFDSAREHYEKTGYFEGRLPRDVVVDEKWYLAAYSDVREALKRGRFSSGQEHFERDGFREGRQPYDGWKL